MIFAVLVRMENTEQKRERKRKSPNTDAGNLSDVQNNINNTETQF